MFDALFQALFSYRPVVFQQGEFRFDLTGASFFAAGVAAVAAALAIFTYRRVQVTQGRPRDRVILTAIRLGVLGILLFCLFRPTLVVRAAVNQQNVVAVLLDDSSSMRIPDAAGKTRGQWVQDEFGGPAAPLLKSLGDRFLVRVFRFSSSALRIQSAKELNFNGSQTKLGAAFDGVREELAGLPVAGVVLVSDRSEEHTSERQSLAYLVCRPL